MAVQKAFVVKNSLEVNQGLLFANAVTNKVGIGTTVPNYLLEVEGEIGVTNLIANNINVSGITTVDSLKIGGVQVLSSGRQLQNITSLDTTTTATIEAAVSNAPNTFTDLSISGIATLNQVTANSLNVSGLTTAVTLVGTNLNYSGVGTVTTLNSTTAVLSSVQTTNLNSSGVSTISNLGVTNLRATGISTLGTVQINSGTITAASGIVTYYGDGQYLTNVTRGIGIQTVGSGGPIGYGATVLDFRGPGISTVTVGSGIGTVNIVGGASIAVTSVAPTNTALGSLWFNINLGRTFIYYDEFELGIGTDKYWVDAAPFNVGVITSLYNVPFASGTANAPSWYFGNSNTTGAFSPIAGQTNFVSFGSTVLNINPSGIIVTGVTTSNDFDTLSDVRYKEDIHTVESALETVDHLRGVKFTWKESGLPSYGVIAQELEEVLPELVHGHDPKTVNYNGIIGVLIEAIKELKAEVEELKKTK